MIRKIKIWIVLELLDLAFYLCPDGKFIISYAFFLNNNIKKLKDDARR